MTLTYECMATCYASKRDSLWTRQYRAGKLNYPILHAPQHTSFSEDGIRINAVCCIKFCLFVPHTQTIPSLFAPICTSFQVLLFPQHTSGRLCPCIFKCQRNARHSFMQQECPKTKIRFHGNTNELYTYKSGTPCVR